ncbi:hypothetical protein BC834DRAFT_613903 [Gloeopeniophorella convolvens]|nr:hypothetical protein BC834DRAFT_613903 [Gloeopeniophorella convolvens]
MDYHPKHPQPFSFSEALKLDPATITEEIARLQNSLKHLKQTQDELRPYLDDPELAQASRENEGVIASQEERISMLTMALVEKGVVASGGHYEVAQTTPAAPSAAAAPQQPSLPPSASLDDLAGTDDGGIVL